MSTIKNWFQAVALFGIVIGTVHIPKAGMANGANLPAGTYTVRVGDETPTNPVGQTPGAEVWVEFVQGGKVVAKEMASVVSDADMPAIADGPKTPRKNSTLVQTLNGGDYFRVWVNKDGMNYLINLAVGAKAATR